MVEDLKYWNNFISGHKEDLEVIYTKYYDQLLNYGLKLFSDPEFVKDCIHDLFVRLYSSKNIKPTLYVRSYLLKSIRNIMIDKLAKQKMLVSENDISFHIPVEEDDLEKNFGNNDEELLMLKKLLSSFDQLSDKQKQILYFRYIQELSHKEIAEILDINEQSSMNLSSRALSKLRKLLLDKENQTSISDDDLKQSLILLCLMRK